MKPTTKIFYWFVAFTFLTIFSSRVFAQQILMNADALLDVSSGEIVENISVLVEGNKIIRMGQQGTINSGDATVIDLKGMTLVPGLMDMHVHLTSDATDNFLAAKGNSVPRVTVKAIKNAEITLLAGFTTVRNLGAKGYSVVAVRDGINAGEVPGPRIWAAGYSVGVTGGHCDDNFSPPEAQSKSTGVADGPWAVRAKVRENIKYGANTIKVCATGGVFSKGTKVGIQQLTEEEIRAAVEEAHMRGLIAAAHAHGTSGIKAAIRAGIDSIEHCSFLDDEAIELALKKGTYFSCDIYNTEYTLAFGEANGVPEENINKEKLVSQAQRDSFTKAVKAGVKMVFGSDAAIYPHGDNGKQFSRMVRFGMTPLQAIQAATIISATLLKQEAVLGQINEGYLADIIAVKVNPLENISVLERVHFVMKDGIIYKK